MADTYLPADVRKRIVDVMRERKMTQRDRQSVQCVHGLYLGYDRNPG